MLMLQQRSLNILELIMGNHNITMKDLEVKTLLTRRQINYDLTRINGWLIQNKFKEIKKQGKEGFLFQNDTNEVLKALFKENVKYILNEDERLMAIYLYLYVSREEISLFHFTETLDVSRGTINDDLKKLANQLEDYSLKLSYSRLRGYHIEGEESTIKYVALLLITKLIDDNRSHYIFHLIMEEQGLSLFNKLTSVCKTCFYKANIHFSDNDLLKVTYIATFILMRGRGIKEDLLQENNFVFAGHNEYAVAGEILDKLGLDHNEHIEFLTSLLLAFSIGDSYLNTPDYPMLKKIIEKIMLKLEVSYGIQLNSKEEVLEQVYAHFRPAYYRIIFQYPIVNPLKDKIKKQYNALFKILKDILEPLNLPNNITVSDDEIAYLTIHFATLIDINVTTVNSPKMVKAAIVCPNGTGISLLLYKELKNIFPKVYFLKPIPISKLDSLRDDVDVIFSTKLVKATQPIFVVSPIMNNLEKANLIKNFYRKIGKTVVTENYYVDDLLKVIIKHAVVKRPSELKEELNNLILNYSYVDGIEGRQPMLSEIVTKELIQLNVEAVDWKDAIKKSATSLVNHHKITEGYVKAMIDSAEESGPYIVITKHVALPHARPEDGANELAISITTLKRPVEFGNSENDPVKYVFCLSALDNITHLNALSELVGLLGDHAFYKTLEEAKEPSEIINFIEKYEEEMSLS